MSIIIKGQHIKCILKNNLVIEGIVESWSDTTSTIKSSDGLSTNIILNTLQDIVLVKIIHKQPSQIKTELENKFSQTLDEPSGDDLRLKKLAELKIMLAAQEKMIIVDKLRDHQITEKKEVNYEQPRFFKK